MGTNQKLQKVFDYMEQHLDETLSLQTLSNMAGYSVPQFYRLFKQLTGDKVNEYLLRRRISEAAIAVKNDKKSIAEIAFQFGFQSHDVFTRAFKRVYGMTPTQYRQSDVVVQPLKRLVIPEQDIEGDASQMTYSIVEMSQFDVIGLECHACTWDSDGAIGELWCEFLQRVSEIQGITMPSTMYGICEVNTCQGNHFVYMASIGVEQIDFVPRGMTVRTIPAQKYFQAQVPQKVTTLDAYTSTINYAKSLGYIIKTQDELEVYEDKFQDPDIHRFRLLIPIQ